MATGRPLLTLALAAVALMLPSLVWGTLPSHSSLHNLTWAAQFSDQVLHGILYPRWLPDSFGGLGAPTFYFYPPLAFWVDALLDSLTFDRLSTSWRLSVTSTVLLGASGLAMHAWLRQQDVARPTALLGALAYMAAPYHLVDHYLRGALAEMAAYAVLPLVMIGVTSVARRQRGSEAALAASYAALLMAHLPTALLSSLTAIPAYVLFVAWRTRESDRWFLARCALCFALALGLAAPYLWPALAFQDAVQLDWIWLYGFQVDRAFLLTPDRWIQPPYMFTVIAASAVGWLLASLSILGRRGLALLWAVVSLVALLLMSGLVPWLWSLPLVSKVQFPWRLLMVVEFATLTALCLAPWPAERLPRLLLVLAIAAFAGAMTVTASGLVDRVELVLKGETPAPQEAREYLPASFPQRPGTGYANLELESVLKQPLIACSPAPRTCRAEPDRFGALRIELDAAQPTTVTLRRFAVPAWRLTPPLSITATEPYRLVSFVAPAGRHDLRLDRQTLLAERWGWTACVLSVIALALLAATTGLAKRWSTRS